MKDAEQSLRECVAIQKYSLTDSYMIGLYNGMLLALTFITGEKYEPVEDVVV